MTEQRRIATFVQRTTATNERRFIGRYFDLTINFEKFWRANCFLLPCAFLSPGERQVVRVRGRAEQPFCTEAFGSSTFRARLMCSLRRTARREWTLCLVACEARSLRRLIGRSSRRSTFVWRLGRIRDRVRTETRSTQPKNSLFANKTTKTSVNLFGKPQRHERALVRSMRDTRTFLDCFDGQNLLVDEQRHRCENGDAGGSIFESIRDALWKTTPIGQIELKSETTRSVLHKPTRGTPMCLRETSDVLRTLGNRSC